VTINASFYDDDRIFPHLDDLKKAPFVNQKNEEIARAKGGKWI